MIELKLTLQDVMCGKSAHERLLDVGIPYQDIINGMVKHWFDDHYFYYQYIPREEFEMPRESETAVSQEKP